MKKQDKQGFTIIELMAVLVIIAIVMSVAVPGIIQVRRRHALETLVNNVQAMAVKTRDLAMKTRRAAVLEVRQDSLWINLLDGPRCVDNLDKRCVSNTGEGTTGEVTMVEDLYVDAKIASCGMTALIAAADGTCSVRKMLRNPGYAICYSGRGVLHTRPSADPNMHCTASTAQPSNVSWDRSCGHKDEREITLADSSEYKIRDGGMMVFNRYGDSLCVGAHAVGVRRAVFFPSVGQPFARIAPEPPEEQD